MVISVLSGKGGTGKTTISAALAEISESRIKIDCDVDASNLYLLYKGENIYKEKFSGGKKAKVNIEKCIGCGVCNGICNFNAIYNGKIDESFCEGCGACTLMCPVNAIELVDEDTADTYITEVNEGILSRADMYPGSDGSGKLVTCLRENVREYKNIDDIVIMDGSPGIGCSVIASMTDTDLIIIVTEPTMSGLSDLKRVYELSKFFKSKVMVCINKYDINNEMTEKIGEFLEKNHIELIGRIPFDKTVMESVNNLRPLTEYKDSPALKELYLMWSRILKGQNGE